MSLPDNPSSSSQPSQPSPLKGRVPPHHLEAEMAVLGSMLLGKDAAVAEARDLLTRADFYRDAHAHLFDAMLALNSRNEPVDLVTLKDELDRQGILDGVGCIR